jgi:hypothetical protein
MATQPSDPKTPEQIHYENISSFFKWGIGLSGTLIGLIASFAIFISYKDRNDMKDEYRNTLTELKSQITELKDDAKTKAQSIKDDAKDAVKSTQDYSEREIDRIKVSTNEIALKETQKQIETIFATDKIQNLIENQAVKEIKSKVSEIVAEQTKNIYQIDDAASSMRNGNLEGLKRLKSYFTNSISQTDSLRALNLYTAICETYDKIGSFYVAQKTFQLIPIEIIDNQLPRDKYQRDVLTNLVNEINDETGDLTHIGLKIATLSAYTNKHFKCFQFDEISSWFNGLKK